jgi:ABC-type Fe3+-hydroxamate transport system substrate-binding protein
VALRYKRIVSLVPSLTELLIDLGLTDQIVGRTRFCVRPKDVVDTIPIIGGTKNPHVDKILELKPDFIVVNKEENRRSDVLELQQKSQARLVITYIATVKKALSAILGIGAEVGLKNKAQNLVSELEQKLEQRPRKNPLRTAYFIWKDPWMSIGRDTYIYDVLQHWNLENVFCGEIRYPTVKLKELASYHPELILLSSEPFPFKEKNIQPVQEACPEARVLLVDGQWFSWYGSRMLDAFDRLNEWRAALN